MTKLLTPPTKFLAVALATVVLSVPTVSSLWAKEATWQAPQWESLKAINAVLAQQPTSLPSEADKVHVVLLVFGHKGGISAACQKDCKGVKAALEAAFADEEDRLVFHDLSEKNPDTDKYYSTKETLEIIKSMEIGSNDNVVVFQSGHGGIGNREDPEMSHKLTMDGGGLTRAQIQRPIEALKPRAILFLTDCCSGFPKKKGGGLETELVSAAEPNVETIRNLVLRPKSTVSITAADDGKLAIAGFKGANPGKAGSAFTVAMLRLWYNNETTYTDWDQFFPVLKKETGLASGGKHLARAFQLNGKSILPSGVVNPLPPGFVIPRLEMNRFYWSMMAAR